jgi:hypothetical protein
VILFDEWTILQAGDLWWGFCGLKSVDLADCWLPWWSLTCSGKDKMFCLNHPLILYEVQWDYEDITWLYLFVLCDLETIINNSSTFNELRMSMLKISPTMLRRQVKFVYFGRKWLQQIAGLLYDPFKHSFESIRVKGTELGTKTFLTFSINLFIPIILQ